MNPKDLDTTHKNENINDSPYSTQKKLIPKEAQTDEK